MNLSDGQKIKRTVKIRLDNREPEDFVMTIYPSGDIGFRQKGKRAEVLTNIQTTFNRARMDTALGELGPQRVRKVRKVKRGLLSL